MSTKDAPGEEEPIPSVLLPPEGGGRAPRVGVPNTNWKGAVGILLAVVVAPNLAVLASSVPDGVPFAVVLGIALATPLVAVLAGIRMAFDIRRGASSSKNLAVASIVVGLGMTCLMIIFPLLFSALTP